MSEMHPLVSPVAVATQRFKAASGEGAVFELKMRLCAGTIPSIEQLPIDTALGKLREAIVQHFQSRLSAAEQLLLEEACRIRNKLLHCEFSAFRERLDGLTSRSRDGGVMVLTGLDTSDPAAALAKFEQMLKGANVGQQAVASTKTKTLRDVFGWLTECCGAGEFEEASVTFQKACDMLEQLLGSQIPTP